MAIPAAALALAPVFKDSVGTLAGGIASTMGNMSQAYGTALVNASEGTREIGFAIADRIRRGGPKV